MVMAAEWLEVHFINTLRPGENGRRFTDDIFTCIFVNEKFCILIEISLMFFPWGAIDNNPALVQMMASHWVGDKPLSETILTSSLTHICGTRVRWVKVVLFNNRVNSLAPGGFENIFQNVFFKLISWIDTLSNSCETALRSMPQNPSDDKSTLVQVMAWCRQAASHYLSQCCPRSLSPYGVTRPQWVKLVTKWTKKTAQIYCCFIKISLWTCCIFAGKFFLGVVRSV